MIDLKNILPEGYMEAKFNGIEETKVYIEIALSDTSDYYFALYSSDGKWIKISKQGKQYIDVFSIHENIETASICVISEQRAYYLKNITIDISKDAKKEMYDKRSLFGKPIFKQNKSGIIPFYENNGRLSLTDCRGIEYTFEKQIKNELVYEKEVLNEDGIKTRYLSLRCKKINGNYIGLIKRTNVEIGNIYTDYIEYSEYKKNKNDISMFFCIENAEEFCIEEYYVIWQQNRQVFVAPISRSANEQRADVMKINFVERNILSIVICYDVEKFGEYQQIKFVSDIKNCECQNDILIQTQQIEVKENRCFITFNVNTLDVFCNFGSWFINVNTKTQKENYVLPVYIDENLLIKELYDGEDTKYKITLQCEKNKFKINRVYGHNALFKKNIQGLADSSIDDFLKRNDISLKGNMYAEYLEHDNGLFIRLYQQMKQVLEAKLVMYHTQGMGVLFTQSLDIREGKIEEFQVEVPDIDWDNKFLKPINSVWFRVALAIRTNEGIYLSSLMQYDLEMDKARQENIYDDRKLYFKPIGRQNICEISMEALPYYAAKKTLSMKFVRPEQLYRSQFTNELLDVQIKKDMLIVKMRCRDCGVEYKGVLMEYRKVKEDDTESYLIPYDSFIKENDSYIMTTKIDMKKYYMRMLYWDIRCAFEVDGKLYTVSCHSNNKRFLNKYKGIFVDRTYPNENSIMFPYATANNSVALMHREICPQDHWHFRLKEKLAEVIYKCFKSIWDKKNIYLIFEKYCTMAQDNGYFFFKYCMDANVEQDFDGEIYYVIDKKAADWEKVMPYSKHVLKYLSLKHMIYLQACKLMISTDTKGHAYVWRSMGSNIKALTYNKKLVFLQHGVTAFKRGHFERGTNVGCESFITTSQFEHDIIHNYLGYPEEEIPITGFARWDVLHDKSEGHREILIMPTWRTWLDDAENEVFAESDYCKNYMALLNDKRLDEILKKYDVTLNFYLHPKFRKFITEFSVVSEKIRLIPFGEEPLNELMMECNLLITDFSSVAWDVYYMNKPVLFYHFDIEVESKTLGFYMDMKNDIFGDRAEKPEELMQLIIEYIESDFTMKEKYKKDREKYFAYIDDNNSERIWKAIQQREW